MAILQVTCPHCGFGKEVPEERIPAAAVAITCPRCKQRFEFNKAAAGGEDGSLQSPRQRPEETAVPSAAGDAAVVTLTCPACGFSRELPAGKVPDGAHVTCPGCRHSFVFTTTTVSAADDSTPPAKAVAGSEKAAPQQKAAAATAERPACTPKPPSRKELPGIGDLFDLAWSAYRQKIGTLFLLLLLAQLPLAFLVALLLLLKVVLPQTPHNNPLLLLVAIPVLLIVLVPALWMGGASIFVIADAANGVREAARKAWPKIGAFFWLFLVSGFIILGGYLLFFIPGIIFTVWFLFAPFILVLDEKGGMSALLQSKEFVRRDLGGVFIRYLPAWLISVALGFVPLVGPLLSLAYMPFLLIYAFELYQNLREIKGDVACNDTTGEKCKWLGAGALGCVMIPVIAMAFMGSILLSLLPYAKSLLQVGNGTAVNGADKTVKPLSAKLMESLAPVADDPEPVEVSAAEYDALLAKEKIAFESGKGISVGPAALLLDQFWVSRKSPHIWLKLRVADLPNSAINAGQLARITITHVWNSANNDVYDPTNSFETGIFQNVSLSAYDAPYRHMGGVRSVYLKEGTEEKDISRATGELILLLPVKIVAVKLDASHIGKETGVAGAAITLKELGNKTVSLDYRGDYRNFVRIVGYAPDGKPVSKTWNSKNTNGDVTALRTSFVGDVTTVKIVVATEVVERNYPFDLEK